MKRDAGKFSAELDDNPPEASVRKQNVASISDDNRSQSGASDISQERQELRILARSSQNVRRSADAKGGMLLLRLIKGKRIPREDFFKLRIHKTEPSFRCQ